MIISQEKGFVFIHNPKVAGSSVRACLETFKTPEITLFGADTTPGSASQGYDLAHIGLDEFARFFPALKERVARLPFFVLFREPEKRFFSSVNEYSRVYGDVDVRFAPKPARAEFLKRLVGRLSALGSAEAVLPELELTHFRPQSIYLQAESFTPDLRCFHIRQFAEFTKALEATCGAPLAFPRENSSEQFQVGGVLGRILGRNAIKKSLRRLPGSMAAMRLLRSSRHADNSSAALSPAQRYGLTPTEEEDLMAFISEFYAQDRALIAGMAQHPKQEPQFAIQ